MEDTVARPTIDPVGALTGLLNGFDVVDLSPVFRTSMPINTPHPDVGIVPDARTFERNGYFMQTLYLPEHAGSHVDAPAHAVRELPTRTIDAYGPTVICGPAKKVDVSFREWKAGDVLGLELFLDAAGRAGVGIEQGDIIFVDFGWDKYLMEAETDPAVGRWWGNNSPGFEEDLCVYLRDRGVRAVGTDHCNCDIASIDGKDISAYGHDRHFLPHEIFVLEGIYNLSSCPPVFYFFALPLRIEGGSGSPLRPIALVPKA